ncbi:hypothetical protein BJF85_19765 [Saccharomonospora sp. CUA-673]|uniref:DUF1707 domain-containing protein n=1 Tax=Saccharomonospora sp. CUA-673 TaxID=1904969 RepID=UPI0009658763|nr:DUF1707 domain-containing protein [Saccharomonospora sp. CUA-673]OLT44711.1 hypothetical protein BJF85_19765 [Saccharomonospora sp. CUA-673]
MAADRSEVRLSDAERQEALDALSEHVRTGRLELSEFDERSAQVSTAKFRKDLRPLFADLPDPRPSVLDAPPPRASTARAPEPPRTSAPQPWSQKLASTAVPIAAVVAIVLFFTVAKAWVVFLLPAVVAFVVGALVNRRR